MLLVRKPKQRQKKEPKENTRLHLTKITFPGHDRRRCHGNFSLHYQAWSILRLMLKRKQNGMLHTCPAETRTFFDQKLFACPAQWRLFNSSRIFQTFQAFSSLHFICLGVYLLTLKQHSLQPLSEGLWPPEPGRLFLTGLEKLCWASPSPAIH